jgi:hypothetical protein
MQNSICLGTLTIKQRNNTRNLKVGTTAILMTSEVLVESDQAQRFKEKNCNVISNILVGTFHQYQCGLFTVDCQSLHCSLIMEIEIVSEMLESGCILVWLITREVVACSPQNFKARCLILTRRAVQFHFHVFTVKPQPCCLLYFFNIPPLIPVAARSKT